MLLTEIHKYTDKKSTDHHNLELAQSELKSVMTHINEDKRITSERMVLFEIMNDIDNCPVCTQNCQHILHMNCYLS